MKRWRRWLAILGGLSLSPACTASFEEARIVTPRASTVIVVDRARCQSLDDRRMVAGAIAKGATVAAGGTGLGVIPDSDPEVRIGLAIGAASLAVVGAVAQVVVDSAGESYVREGCP